MKTVSVVADVASSLAGHLPPEPDEGLRDFLS
jgi:hypothetical protein